MLTKAKEPPSTQATMKMRMSDGTTREMMVATSPLVSVLLLTRENMVQNKLLFGSFHLWLYKSNFSVCGKKFPDCSRLSQPLEITKTLEYVYLNLDFNQLTKKAYYQRWARVFFFLAHCSTILYLKMTENLSRNFARTRNSVEKRTDSQVSSSTLPKDD